MAPAQPGLHRSGGGTSPPEPTIDVFLRRFKEALFGILFVIHKNEEGSHSIWSIIEVLVDHLQDLTFPILVPFFPWQHEIHWLAEALEYSSPETMIAHNNAIFIVLISLLGLTLVNAAWVGYSFSQNRFRFIWTLKTLRTMLGLFANVLYIPSLTIFVSFISYCDDGQSGESGAACWKDNRLFPSIATVVISVVFVCLVLAVAGTFFDPDPKDKDVESRPHSRLDVLYVACRTVLIVLQTVLQTYGNPDGSLNKWIMALTCVACSVSLALAFTWYMPYYHFKYSLFRAALQCNFAWASLCCVFTLIRPHSDIGIIYILLIPFVLIFSILLTRARRRMIEATIATNADALTLELKARFLLERANLLFRPPPKTNLTLTTASPGDLGYDPNAAAEGGGGRGGVAEEERRALDEANSYYVQGMKHMAGSCLIYLFAGQFQLLQMGNKAQCLSLYTKGETLAPRADEAFMIFRRKRMLNERYAGGDVIDFIAFEQNMAQARKHERRATTAVLQFWSELLRKRPSFRRLQLHGAAISGAVSLAQSHFIALIKLSPNSPNVYRLYGRFLMNVLNDQKQGQELVDHADELEESLAHEGALDTAEEAYEDERGDVRTALVNPLSDNNALFTISGDMSNLGIITAVNPAALKLFNYRRSDLMHKNINIIVPSPFSEPHDDLLKRYLDTGFAKVIDRPRQVLSVHSTGYIMTTSLLVKQITSEGGRISFMGIMSRILEGPDEEFIITNENLHVLHITRGCTELFGEVPEDIQRGLRKIPLGDWLEGCTLEKVEEFTGRNKKKCMVRCGMQMLEVTLGGDRVAAHGLVCFILKLKVKRTGVLSEEEGKENDHPAGHREEQMPSPAGMMPAQCPFAGAKPVQGQGLALPAAANASQHSINPMAFSAASLAKEAVSTSRSMSRSMELSEGGGDGKAARSSHDRLSIRLRQKAIEKHLAAVEEREDDRQSSASGASRTSGAGAGLLKGIIAFRNDMANKRLRWLTYAMSLCLLAMSVLAVAENLIYQSFYNNALTQLQRVEQRGDAAFRAVSVMEGIRSLQLARLTGSDQVGPFEAAAAVERLKEDATALKSIVVDLSPASGEPFSYTVTLNSSSTMHSTQLLEAINTAVLKITYILAAPATDPSVPLEIDFLLQNVGSAMMDGLNRSAKAPLDNMEKPEFNRLGLSSIGPLIYLFIFMAVIWPLYGLIEENRKKFLNVFLDIPKEVVKGIHENHLNRFMALEEEIEDEEDANIDVERHLMREKLMVDNQGPGGLDGLMLDPDRSGDLDEPEDYTSNTGVFRWLFHVRDQHQVLPKITLIFLICCAYFYSAGGITYKFAGMMSTSTTQVYWATQRPILIRQIDLVTREAYLNHANIAGTSFPLPDLSVLLSTLNEIHQGLVYGSDSMDVPSTLSSNDETHINLILSNACVDESPTDCTTYDNGILSHGLQSALEFFSQTAKTASASPDLATTELIRALDLTYLTPSLSLSTSLYSAPVTDKRQWFHTYHLAFTVVFVIAMVAAYVGMFRPLVMRMAEDIRRTHVMLFMIPPEVLSKVAVIKDWMAEKKGKKRIVGSEKGGKGMEKKEGMNGAEEKGGSEMGNPRKVSIMVSAVDNMDIV
ncbi:hypothetical protein HDV00_012825 [Rhizophlyctis rosea]|nr:hypothetical protein HDV00_012825 [Rhizophlyctis rosea]